MNSAFGKNLRAFIESRDDLTQQILADQIGVTLTTVNGWINRGTQPRKSNLADIARIYDLSEDDLVSLSNGFYAKQYGLSSIAAPAQMDESAPVLGCIAAGDAREALEFTDETHEVPRKVAERWPGGFFLVVRGDSMNLILPEGCYAYIAPHESFPIKSGDVAAVKVNGDDATVKRIKLFDGVVILEPESTNPEHRRRVIDESDPDAPNVRLLGKVVWYDYEVVRF